MGQDLKRMAAALGVLWHAVLSGDVVTPANGSIARQSLLGDVTTSLGGREGEGSRIQVGLGGLDLVEDTIAG